MTALLAPQLSNSQTFYSLSAVRIDILRPQVFVNAPTFYQASEFGGVGVADWPRYIELSYSIPEDIAMLYSAGQTTAKIDYKVIEMTATVSYANAVSSYDKA